MVRMGVEFTTTYLSITSNVLSSNPVYGKVYSIKHYVIRLSVTCDRSVFFSRYSGSSTNKTDHHDITKLLFKVVLNTITLIPNPWNSRQHLLDVLPV